MKRREILKSGTALVAATAFTRLSFAAGDVPVEEAGIAELQAAMTAGRTTSSALVTAYLARMDKLDTHGPAINAVIERNPEALAIAEALDRERKEKGPRGPLHGIPVVIKDNLDTADKMSTTAGSLALAGSTPPLDSTVAKKLREAGAVLLAKTNLSEWANLRSSHSTSGWSGRGGQTKNPYVLDRNTSGSSSGSAAATAASLCAVSIGTETDGSIVSPSSTCSLVGIKPTLGLVSRAGIIPIAHSQDTAGPITRTVADAAAVLTAIAGSDPRDAASAAAKPSDYTKFLDPAGLKGARLGIVRKSFGFNDDVDRLLDSRIEAMKKLGAVIVDPVEIPSAGKLDESELLVLLYEFKADLNAYLATLGPKAPVHTLAEVIDFNEKNREKEMPWFGQDLLVQAEAKGPLTDKAYKKALAKDQKLSRAGGIDAALAKDRLDALIAPTNSPAWPIDWVNGDHFTGGYSQMSAVAGYPHVTVPAGYVHGLPIGISFFASAWSEPLLIKLAFAFEQAIQARQPPKFLPSVDYSK
jgi:amidase